jgi:hypothetical protein
VGIRSSGAVARIGVEGFVDLQFGQRQLGGRGEASIISEQLRQRT